MRSCCRLRRPVILSAGLLLLFIWLLHRPVPDRTLSSLQYPLLSKYVLNQGRNGGEWTKGTNVPPETIIEAAELALNQSRSTPHRHIPRSAIPLILHQTWKNTHPETWPEAFQQSTERWLEAVEDSSMAYFLWDDSGIAQFMRHFEPDLEDRFYALPSNVERSDVFRVLVSKWIGGVYGDMDTEPIRMPAQWIASTDVLPWQDPERGDKYSSTESIKAIVGLEADCPPESDLYWRMGYSYPVQLTQWSFAWAPGHPILQIFLDRVFTTLQMASNHSHGQFNSYSVEQELFSEDPLTLTGPVAFTIAVRGWLESKTGLRWNALSGLADGGRSKSVGGILVLPITGFSPGRGRYGNMGSKAVTDPSARLVHHAQGSWRTTSLLVEYGKFCRTVFGLCRDWSKVPHNFII